MPRELIRRLRRVNATRRPESSVALRAAVLGAVLTGALALAAEGAISPQTTLLLVPAFPVAYWISYRRRDKDNWHIKIALALGAIVALFRFFGDLRGIASFDEVRFPLADLFLWVQLLHSLDLPARKDLHFSLGSSLALMAIAGSISQDLRFALFVVVYFACAIAALVLAHRSEIEEDSAGQMRVVASGTSRVSTRRWRDVAGAAAAVAVAGALVFLLIPQPTSARTFALPFSFGSGVGSPAGAGVANPGFSANPSLRSSGVSYYGFAERMDLRVRGELSDELVMRVRSSAPAMWKGLAFDTYDGVTWTGDDTEGTPLQGEPPYHYPPAFRSLGPRATVTQTFYIEAEQPSAIFAAGQPDAIWFDGDVRVDELGSLQTASTLTPGTVYSVVSTRGAASAQELRSTTDAPVPDHMARYLQLPADLPERVRSLARRITRGATNTYDRVKAIESYLRTNYRYTIDSPVPPEGRDAVDHFLFDAKVGFCEQFASATVVMLRSLGIPARVAAGYAVGHRNPFTGYYEVRGSDAHTWVEAWFPDGLGWYEFDPTFAVPPAHADLAEVLPLAKVFRFAADKLGDISFDGGGAVRYVLVVVGLLTTLAGAFVAWRKLRRRAPAVPVAGPPAAELGPVARAFRRLEQAMAPRGVGRRPSETARQFMSRVSEAGDSGADVALGAFELERYGAKSPSPPVTEEATRALLRLARAAVEQRGARLPERGAERDPESAR